eukprot:g1000.t1
MYDEVGHQDRFRLLDDNVSPETFGMGLGPISSEEKSQEISLRPRGVKARTFPLNSQSLFLFAKSVFKGFKINVRRHSLYIGQPLSFFDNYVIEGGVPTFVFKTEEEEVREFGSVFALSPDGTYLAFSKSDRQICVYSLLDYSIIAEGVDLIHQDDRFIYLSFWGDSKEEMVAITQQKRILFYSISSASTSQENDVPFQRELIKEMFYEVDDSFREGDNRHFIVEVSQCKLWLVEWTTEGTIAMRITGVTKKHFNQVKLYTGLRRPPSEVRMSINARVVMTTFEWKYEPHRNHTRVCNDIMFESRELYQVPNKISGKCIAQDDSGNYFLFWRQNEDDSSYLRLYSKELLQNESPIPFAARSLGKGIVSVKATFIDHTAWPFNEIVDSSMSNDKPLVCVLLARSSGIAVMAWDSKTERIIKEIDTKMNELKISQDAQIEFCVAPNLLWFAVGSWKESIIGLFSFVSGVQVWSVHLDLDYVSPSMSVPFTFDQSSSKLIVNGKKGIFIFLPRLIDKYNIEYKSLSYELNLEREVSFSNLDICYQRLISQRFLFCLFIVNFDLEDENRRIAIASSQTSSKVALMVHHNDEQSCLVIATWETVFSLQFREWLKATMSLEETDGDFSELRKDIKKINIDKGMSKRLAAKVGKCHVMLYPNRNYTDDSIALFALGEGIEAVFIDLENNAQEFYYLDEDEWFGCTQSKDGLKATCFRDDGILVIDLHQRKMLQRVHYNVGLLTILHAYRPERNLNPSKRSMKDFHRSKEVLFWANQTAKCFSSPMLSPDGTSILLGWDAENNKPILVEPTTSEEELTVLDKQRLMVMPCWALDEAHGKFAFLEFNERTRKIIAIGVYNQKNQRYKKLEKLSWTPHMTRVLDGMTTNRLLTFDMCFDKNTGYLWMTSIERNTQKDTTLILLPIGPFSTQGCVPCLYMQDYLFQNINKEQLDKLGQQVGCALHNMPFNGMTNVHLSLINQDVGMTGALLKNASENDVEIALTVLKRNTMDQFHNLLDIAIEQKNKKLVNTILELLEEHPVSFISSAMSIKRCFEELWRSYRKSLERVLKKDFLCREFSRLEVPSDILSSNNYLGVRVGTCTDIDILNNSYNEEATSEYWRASHKYTIENIRNNGNMTQVTAVLKIFCIDDVCKVGLNGIIRLLLALRAPSRIYSFSLIRWCIIWKWEHIWKSKTKRSLLYYLFFLGVFSAYAILMGVYGNKIHEKENNVIIVTFPLVLSCLLAVSMVPQEMNQLTTYIKDGKTLFPANPSWGIKYYFSSRWNLVDLFTYVVLLLVILPLHLCSLSIDSILPCLYGVIAFECIFVWLKMWYYAQPFAETGALVLMIENIIRDCFFFLLLAGIVLVAFSVALYVMFQYTIQQYHPQEHSINYDAKFGDEDDEMFKHIKASFRNPQEVMLTLFYAMIGTYEVDVYSESGSLSPFFVFLFVLYLSIQSIVMFNMLIAIMSDTYDRVKSTEEEQLLMGRALFIDACEAALSANQIKKMESDIGKYLYVIVPEDADSSEETTLWQGRVKTIEENIQKIVTESQANIMKNIKKDIKLLEDDVKGIKNDIKSLIRMVKTQSNVQELTGERQIQRSIGHFEEEISRQPSAATVI